MNRILEPVPKEFSGKRVTGRGGLYIFLLFGWFELVGCTQGDEEAKASPIGNGQGKLTNGA